jgi:protein subunit release factor B
MHPEIEQDGPEFFSEDRNKWLEADDLDLMKFCRFEPFKSTGRGGQKKNKTSSAVRLVHEPSGIAVTASTSRSQHENRLHALKKLRFEIALKIRSEKSLVAMQVETSMRNSKYHLWIAWIMDVLSVYSYDIKPAAIELDVSTSKLAKLLFRDHLLWQEVNRLRVVFGFSSLKNPK